MGGAGAGRGGRLLRPETVAFWAGWDLHRRGAGRRGALGGAGRGNQRAAARGLGASLGTDRKCLSAAEEWSVEPFGCVWEESA